MVTEILPTLVLGTVLLLGALGLMLWHARSWRAALRGPLDEAEYQFRRQQFRRRMQTAALAGIVAVSLPIGVLLIHPWPRVGVLFWGGVLLLVAWICLLGLLDVVATGRHYGQVRNQYLKEHAKLQAELYHFQSRRRNGPPSQSPPAEDPPEEGEAGPEP